MYMPTVKQIKARLKKLGVDKEVYDGLKKAELETLVAQHEGGGGGGGGGTVTVAAASVGVKSPSPGAAAAARAPSPKKASPKQTKEAKAFLATAAGGGFRKSPSPKTLKVKKKPTAVRISPPKGNKTKKAKKADIVAMKVETCGTFKAVDSKWKPPPPWAGFKTKARSPPVSPKVQQITYKNGHAVPVMLAQSVLGPAWNPRKAAVNDIPGHNHPLDPGASISFSVRKGNTLYVYDGNFNPMETLCTKADAKYGREVETWYVPTKLGQKSNFTKGAVKKADGGGGAWAPTKKGGRRRRTRRRRRRRRRRTRR
jgi:hypothetical protein